jgi:hypothetical protein
MIRFKQRECILCRGKKVEIMKNAADRSWLTLGKEVATRVFDVTHN